VTTAAVRTLDARDADAALQLVDDVLGATAYRDRAREIVTEAVGGDPEWRLRGVRNSALRAVVAFGPVAGAAGVWRIGLLLFAPDSGREVSDPLIAHVARAVVEAGARMLVAELPADEVIGFTLTALRANGFRQEARITYFYGPGVAQLFLRRDVNGAAAR